jgi:hypothetical protein
MPPHPTPWAGGLELQSAATCAETIPPFLPPCPTTLAPAEADTVTPCCWPQKRYQYLVDPTRLGAMVANYSTITPGSFGTMGECCAASMGCLSISGLSCSRWQCLQPAACISTWPALHCVWGARTAGWACSRRWAWRAPLILLLAALLADNTAHLAALQPSPTPTSGT